MFIPMLCKLALLYMTEISSELCKDVLLMRTRDVCPSLSGFILFGQTMCLTHRNRICTVIGCVFRGEMEVSKKGAWHVQRMKERIKEAH